ncbi:hypothetical protein M5689_020091 [Euphorbia peplus]|nr:hypothetical protein M5689_020091 [Euphorbia peplus]
MFETALVGNVQIQFPDLYHNGLLVIHGMQDGVIVHLSPESCFTNFPQQHHHIHSEFVLEAAIMCLLLLASVRENYNDLISIIRITMSALQTTFLFHGSDLIRFHIIPTVYLNMSELEKLAAHLKDPLMISCALGVPI